MNRYCNNRRFPNSPSPSPCPPPRRTDFGPEPFIAQLACQTEQNQNFRTTLWTGSNMQLTLMCIPPNEEIGFEIHQNTDQFFYIESGSGMVKMGSSKERLDYQKCFTSGDAIFIPQGTCHNIINNGNCPIKLFSIYAPPHHARGAIVPCKES